MVAEIEPEKCRVGREAATRAIGPYNVSMNVSWAALVVSALIAIWGFMQLPQ
jgi:hypothetical protein